MTRCINADVPNIDKIRKYDAYEEKQKRNTVGFAKLEIRGEDCRLEIHLRGIYSRNGFCKVYLMRQEKGGIAGFTIGEMRIVNGGGDFGTAFRAGKIGASPYGIYDMEGLFLLSDDERIFASRWKDGETLIIDRDRFRVWSAEEPKQPSLETPEPKEPEEVEPSDTEPEQPQIQESQPRLQPQEAEEPVKPDVPVQTAEDATHAAQEESENLSATEIPMRNVFPRHDWSAVWEMLKKDHPLFAPFEDETVCCMQIELKDLRDLPKRYWYLGNNSFLLHGFFNYHYLILGNIEKNRWFIGIPGIYQRQERAMAAIFGFPEFLPVATKEKADTTEEPVNRFGYWYRFIEE